MKIVLNKAVLTTVGTVLLIASAIVVFLLLKQESEFNNKPITSATNPELTIEREERSAQQETKTSDESTKRDSLAENKSSTDTNVKPTTRNPKQQKSSLQDKKATQSSKETLKNQTDIPKPKNDNSQDEKTTADNQTQTETKEPEKQPTSSETNNDNDQEAIARLKDIEEKYRAGITAGDPNKGGYPYSSHCPDAKINNAQFADQWGMYICESVSYVAWRVYDTYGYMPYWGGRGNAEQWIINAREAGYKVTEEPQKGTVGISEGGAYGHAVWVEEVSGSRIHISQYNYPSASTNYRPGEYSEQWMDGAAFKYIIFDGNQ